MSNRIAQAMKQLIAVTRPRPDQSEGGVSAMAERFSAVFSEYPEDVVIAALNEWPKASEWFPTEKELRDLLNYLRFNSASTKGERDARGRSDTPSGMTEYFWQRVAALKGEAYARSWLWGGVTAMFTGKYVFVNQVGHDRLWRDCADLIRECGVAIVVDDEIARLLVQHMAENNIGTTKRRRA